VAILPNLQSFIGSSCHFYWLYCPKKNVAINYYNLILNLNLHVPVFLVGVDVQQSNFEILQFFISIVTFDL
jgi:hypothetical protein